MKAGITPQPVIHENIDSSPEKQIKKTSPRYFLFLLIPLLLVISLTILKKPRQIPVEIQNRGLESTTTIPSLTASPSATVTWSFNGDRWMPSTTPPNCPDTLLEVSPVDFTQATGILYPGQYRGNDYKAHGGMRFDNNKDNKIALKLPFTAKISKIAHYIEAGEIQYLIDFIHPCGILIRFDHLKTLTPLFAKVFETLPPPKPDDSRTTNIDNGVTYTAGQLVATEIGFSKPKLNVGVDFGLYDLRNKNNAALNTAYAQQHQQILQMAGYAVCWLDYLPTEDMKIAKALPGADQKNQKQSDYCK